MNPSTLAAALVLFCGSLSSCASGPEYNSIADRIPPVPEHCGRIYFFRTSSMGTLVHPEVSLNGEVVGKSVPGGFFFVDEAAGDYEVGIAGAWKPKWKLHVDERQTSYVETFIQFEVIDSYPVARLVDSAAGDAAVHGLQYTGHELPALKPAQ
jgi:hypothetical protein